IDDKPVDTMRRAWYPYTLPFNMTGNPAISIPCGWDKDGLPIGLQLIGRLGADSTLLHAAALFEQARPWSQRRPDLSELETSPATPAAARPGFAPREAPRIAISAPRIPFGMKIMNKISSRP